MENQLQDIYQDINEYIRGKLIERFAEVYKIDYEEMNNLVEDDKFKLHKKFNSLCDKMPKDKNTFDQYMKYGFSNIKGTGYVYESLKEVLRGVKDLLTCCSRRSLHNIENEVSGFGPLIIQAKETKDHFEKSFNTY